MCETLRNQLENIDLQCSAESIEAAPDHAASFALLVTELVTNAAKHAYDTKGGVVHARLTQDGEARLLEISDHGGGLGPNFSIESAGEAGLGMNLIQALTHNLGGTIEWVSDGGTTFSIRFLL